MRLSRNDHNLKYHIFKYGICEYGRQERELRALRKRLSSDSFELIILYVRRRIGKTFLVLNAVSGYDYVYYLATERNNLKKFKEMAESKYGEVKHVRGPRDCSTTWGR